MCIQSRSKCLTRKPSVCCRQNHKIEHKAVTAFPKIRTKTMNFILTKTEITSEFYGNDKNDIFQCIWEHA